jgi:hypothetical protein
MRFRKKQKCFSYSPPHNVAKNLKSELQRIEPIYCFRAHPFMSLVLKEHVRITDFPNGKRQCMKPY